MQRNARGDVARRAHDELGRTHLDVFALATVRVSGRVQAKGGGSIRDFQVEVSLPRHGDNYWTGPERPVDVHDPEGRFVLGVKTSVVSPGGTPSSVYSPPVFVVALSVWPRLDSRETKTRSSAPPVSSVTRP